MKHRAFVASFLLLWSSTCGFAVRTGSLSGVVKDASGQPAVGIAVAIRSAGSMIPIERKTLSDLKGQFNFLSLFPGTYTLQVNAHEPWNVVSKELTVMPGRNDSLVIHLTDIFTMAFKPPRINSVREDAAEEAKWVLRTSRATRPILRFQDTPEAVAVMDRPSALSVLPFRGVLEINSSGDSAAASLDGNPFNSSFAFIQPLSPRTQLLVAGGIGFSDENQTSVRSALHIKLDPNHTATIAVGLRQFALPLLSTGELSQALASLGDESTTLSQIQNFLVSLDVEDQFKLGNHLSMMGGMTFDHVESIRTRNILRPRIGITANLPHDLTLSVLAMNTSTGRAKTFNLPEGGTITLPAMARMALSPNSAQPESVNHVEFILDQQISAQTHVIVSLYQDQFRDRTMFLSDFNPVNVGNSTQHGYSVTFVTHPAEKVVATLGYSYAGGLEEANHPLMAILESGRENPLFLQPRNYRMVTAGVAFEFSRTQTHFNTVYRKIFGLPVTTVDPFQNNFYASENGLNLLITQRLPNFTTLPGQLEAQADFRNLFAQGSSRPGYSAPLALLSQQQRVIRGGLSFKF